MPMIGYGMKIVSPSVTKTSMENLDRCKSAYIKAVMGFSRNTSNTFVLALTNQKTLCETLRKENYVFEVWNEYAQNLKRKRAEYREKRYKKGPAFTRQDWKSSNRLDRGSIRRATYHGYHHELCVREGIYEKVNSLCRFKYCGVTGIDRYHIVRCEHFEGKSIPKIVRELENCV